MIEHAERSPAGRGATDLRGRRGAKTLLLIAVMLLPGCLVVTCGSSDLEQREVEESPQRTDTPGGSF